MKQENPAIEHLKKVNWELVQKLDKIDKLCIKNLTPGRAAGNPERSGALQAVKNIIEEKT